ncbi:MAG: tetratricopeptide repeat protein, partial [Myxococcales bacterium]|nr:tetratricopeptide repeat protein [Myxococcales bacterium]
MRRALLISAFLWPLPALAAPPAADEPPPAEPAEAAPAADEPAPTEAPPASPADEVLALRQKRAKELRARAATMLASGRTDEGIDALRAALDAYPAYPLALNELGAAFAKKGKLAEAQASFEAALELDPSMTTARANLAEVLRRQNRHEDALAELGKVVEADPRDAGAWYSTAASLMTLKREPQALFAMERYLEVAPKGAGDKERVASVGERVKALRDDGVAPEAPWAAAVAETPETPPEPGEPSEPTVAVAPGELPFHVGDTAYYAKRYGDALKSYEADLAGHPDDVALLYKIGATKAVMNDYAGALRAWRQALV